METLSKEQEIDFIAGRIIDEERKHSHWNKEWHIIAASKIHSQWKEYWTADRDKRILELEKSHKELLVIAKHYIKNWDFVIIANADKLVLPDKPKDK